MTDTIHPRYLAYTGVRHDGHDSVKAFDEKTGADICIVGRTDTRDDISRVILCHYLEVQAVSADLIASFARHVVDKFPDGPWRVTSKYIGEWLTTRWEHFGGNQVTDDLRG